MRLARISTAAAALLVALEPRLHRLVDPAYRSWVAAVVIAGNLPVPSGWSVKAVRTAPLA